MAQYVKAKTDREVQAFAKKAGRHAVGGAGCTGLALLVTEGKAGLLANWVLRVRSKSLGAVVCRYGRYPDVSLQTARELAREDNDLIAKGINPNKARAQAAQEKAEAEARASAEMLTVGAVLHEWIEWRALNQGCN